MQIDTSRARAPLSAVLGPTNTGKTHLAMERMLAHGSGVIGFPLRLLARENYDRAVKEKGVSQVALVTGEEKIVPAHARYYLTTVESMPTDRTFDFVAIDEIQMCADADRGHIFTDRLLNYRGTQETMFLGAETIRGVIQALVPETEFHTRPRLSTLRYTGYKKLTRLKPRSCIVAFSANDVYSIAELIRRQSGGAAIVMGALSPRTRNAQVDMFQSGEVDFLVATDAVGMGLNMDVDHVALAATRKFDGRIMRDLQPSELAQIAGRAGRHMNDGSFGTTGEVTGLGASAVEAVENHTFAPLPFVYWRNSDLAFGSLKKLKSSLAERPEHAALRRAREADDERMLDTLMTNDAVMATATTADSVKLLWEVARIPDFRQIQTDEHPQLLARIYEQLTSSEARISSDWISERVKRIHNLDGDIDTLMARIAAIRTWTFVAHQSGWLGEPQHWQEQTRAIEDGLSDALHERLTQRFVDKRTSQLVKTLKDDVPLATALHDDGALEVEGHHLGQLSGFRFVATESDTSLAAKVLDSAAGKALRGKIADRISMFEADADGAFTFSADGRINWRGEPVARFVKGAEMLHPRISVLTSDLLEFEQKERIEARLQTWANDLVRDRLGLLLAAREAPLQGVARGLVFQLTECLGALPRHEAESEIKALTKEDRHELRRFGIRIGRHLIYIPTLLRPAAAELSVLLWGVFEDSDPLLPPPPAGRVSLRREKHEPEGWLRAAGFRPAGTLFVRADMLERLAEMAWKRLEAAKGPFEGNEEFLSLAGCSAADLAGILSSLGFQADKDGKWVPKSWRNRAGNRAKKVQPAAMPQAPQNQAPQRQAPQPALSASASPGAVPLSPTEGLGAKPTQKRRPPKRFKKRETTPHHTSQQAAKQKDQHSGRPRAAGIDPDNPFAKLMELKFKS
ncbi:helicase-related protein [Magnetovibrio blakemorei]|uniref:Helicase C-terminal domain-containing protein n=1 Tax=Magnetovibrio blakemorei TaxID=28181 RepID=A0A1E5QCH0_9PROT|nr:helicase-related protein [Magnetovibrio blakemorei]OEJ69692.1 hypothetical protein BEN30_02340 [Magnetovibrio blakemorei]